MGENESVKKRRFLGRKAVGSVWHRDEMARFLRQTPRKWLGPIPDPFFPLISRIDLLGSFEPGVVSEPIVRASVDGSCVKVHRGVKITGPANDT